VGAGFSLLHRVRREAVEALERSMLAEYGERTRTDPPAAASALLRRDRGEMPDLVVWTTRLATAKACLAAGAHRAIVPAWALEPDAELPEGLVVELGADREGREVECALAEAQAVARSSSGTSGSCDPAEKRARMSGLTGVSTRSTPAPCGSARSRRERCLALAGGLGTRRRAIAGESGIGVGIAVLGRQELMVTEHCVLTSSGPCSQRCGTCTRRERWYALRDRKGYGFPVIRTRLAAAHLQRGAARPHARAA
jgi:U32 family peptidase